MLVQRNTIPSCYTVVQDSEQEMISFDLDMTLLDHRAGRIPDSAMDAIDRLRRKGHRIVLSTGRDMDNVYSRKYRDLIKPDGIVHMNGTKVTVGKDLIFDHRFSPDLLLELLRFCEEQGFGIGLTIGDDDYYVNPGVVREYDIRHWGICGRQFKDPKKIPELPIRTLAFIGTKEQAAAVEQRFPSLKLPLFSFYSGADVIERGFSKADGLVRLAKAFGEKEDLSGTVAFGDSMNDIEVIRAAGVGIAMGNAVPELREAADYVTDPIDRDGIFNACKKLGLI